MGKMGTNKKKERTTNTIGIDEIHINDGSYGLPKNPRLIKDDRFKALCESVKNNAEYMTVRPIIVDGDTGVILGGNMRYRACKELGMTELPESWVKHVHGWTDEKKRKFILMDNNTYGEYDWDVLANEWEVPEMLESGFFADELRDLLEEADAQAELDSIPEVDEEPKSRRGEIYQLGAHRLMCGDAYSQTDIVELANRETGFFVYTDPMFQDSVTNLKQSLDVVNAKHLLLMCTLKQGFDFFRFDDWVYHFDLVLRTNTISQGASQRNPHWRHKNILYFTKNDGTKTCFSCANSKGFFSDAPFYPSVIESKRNPFSLSAEKEKPVEAVVKILSGFKAEKVLDLFGGSGSTLIACEILKRNCYIMEIEEVKVDVIRKGWAEYKHGKGCDWEQLTPIIRKE